nr:copia protein [Tanacetum cinerariifolium]
MKYLRALHPKWRAKVTAIEESKDLTSLSLDELIGNLKVHEMIIKKDSKIVKEKVETKSLALKANKNLLMKSVRLPVVKTKSMPWRSHDDKNGKSDRKCFRCGDPNHLIRECPKPLKDKNQRVFVGGSWSDSNEEDDEKVKNETCLVAQASSEICLGVDLEPDEWIKDSGFSKHMPGNQKLFLSYKAYNGGNVIFGSNLCGNIIGKGTEWVFINKLDENGVVFRNKARLVTQGYNQQEGIDYDETYAPVARLDSIRILLAYACALDFKVFQMGVKSAFLNGFINEEVYVAQPPGFIDIKKPNHVYKLKKALYGLKQAPKACLNLIIAQIYVDDIKFGSSYQDMCDEFAKIMHDEFEMSMMGELNFFLGLQIKQMEDCIFFNQSKYIKEILKKFRLEDSKPMKTPMSSDTKLTKDKECESVDSTKYRGMIGTDIAKITRKEPKTEQNQTRDEKSTQESGIIKKSQPKSTLVNLGQLTK